MAEKEIDLRRLVIKAFHMTDVEWGEHNNITTDGHMTVSKEMIDQLVAQDDCIEKIDIQIIKPGDHDLRMKKRYLTTQPRKRGIKFKISCKKGMFL